MRRILSPRPTKFFAALVAACAVLANSTTSVRRCAAAEPDSTREPAADKPSDKKPAPSAAQRPALDDALLKDLDNELLEGAGDLKDKVKPKSIDGKHPSAKKPRQPPDEGEDIGIPSADEDPLVRISQEMRSVENLISEQARHPDAEHMQQRVVDDLARLIEQAEKQASQQQSSSSKSKKQQGTTRRQKIQQPKQQQGGKSGKDSDKPAQDSTDRLGKAEAARPDPELMKGLMKDAWGHLPPKAKELMMQTSPERFLPQYELMIEKYYKRLAEEQSSK
jgi:hypothetical protein